MSFSLPRTTPAVADNTTLIENAPLRAEVERVQELIRESHKRFARHAGEMCVPVGIEEAFAHPVNKLLLGRDKRD